MTSINAYTSGSNYLTTWVTYFDTGNIQTITDVNGAQTTFGYGACGNSFPTNLSEPLGMSRSIAWNCDAGVVTSLTDENSQTTSITYNDPYFWRPASQNFPDGGQSSWTYNSPTSVITTVKMNASQNIVRTTLLDGLGRTSQTQLNNDPEGVDYVDTAYDSLGLIASVSNPYRSTSDSTYGITQYQYDALGRVTATTLQDGSVLHVSYADNTITTTDPAGKATKSVIDGLGRAVQVFEDPAGLNYETDYQYDPLGNLTRVDQKGGSPNAGDWRTRQYAYDFLSRMTSETTPEAGTITYSYNSNGDLATRVAPAPNQTGSNTVTTTYSWDTLHRLTLKTYSDGSSPADFTYDVCTFGCAPIANGKGRLVHESNDVNAASTFSYDAVGRILKRVGCLPANCSESAFPVDVTYDFAGNMTSYSNGVGVTFSQTFDAAGRATALTSSLVDSQHPATLATVDSSVGYYPTGQLRKMLFGNGVTESVLNESRLTPCRMSFNTSGGSIAGCDDAVASGNVQDFHYGYGAWGSANNDSVTDWIGSGTQNFGRSYGFDSLNRVQSMSAPGDSCSGLSWTYDAWGNRTDQNVTSGTCSTFHATVNTQNRLSGAPYQYDAAGNLTYDGSHSYTYDAENRLIAVDGGGTARYVYDALGRRAEKTTGSTSLDYIYDPAGNLLTEWCTNCGGYTGPTTEYVFLSGQLVADYKDSTTYFVHTDHLASARLLTDLNRAVAQNVDYLPFGEAFSGSSAVPVVDPSFESGSSGWALGFWGCTSSITTAQAHSGAFSLAQTGSTTGGTYQDLGGIVSGSSYQVSVWVRADAGTTAQAELWVHDTNGGNSVESGLFTPGTSWQQVTLTFTGDSTSAMRIHLYFAAGGGTIYYDDVQVTLLNSVGDTTITTHKFTGDERDSETNLDHTWFRQYSSQFGRWTTPDRLGGSVYDPQSLNRYAYALNDPCALVDGLGLNTCQFNIAVNNKAGISPEQLAAAKAQINALLGAVPSTSGDTVGADFDFTGKADYKLNIINGSIQGDWGRQNNFLFIHFAPSVNAAALTKWASNYPSSVGRLIGTVGVHELTHRITGIGDLPYAGGPNQIPNLMQIDSFTSQYGSSNPQQLSNFYLNDELTLSPDQVAALYKKCIKKHPGASGGGGGGGGGNQGGFSGVNIPGVVIETCFGSGGECNGTYSWVMFPSWWMPSVQRK